MKLWDAASGFSKLTKAEHEGPVTSVMFTKGGSVVLSCSYDGTVRAFDTKRLVESNIIVKEWSACVVCFVLDTDF